MGTIEVIFPSGGQPGKILKWRVRMDTIVSAGRILFVYHNVIPGTEDAKGPEKKFRAARFGRVTKLLAKEGDIVQPGQVIMTLEGCRHPTVMKDLCAECGVDLRVEGIDKDNESIKVSQASVPMVHSIPELKVCPELAEKIGKEDEERLLRDRKLALLVDLDQTIVHTTNDNIPPNIKDVYHYQLYGPNSPWYHTRLRPHTRHFLSEMSRLYELHICTFGARNYAHTVAALLDKDGDLFSHRILSRDECFDPASKTANLKALFPCGDDLVCIIDDREDVWQGCGNLVQVKPYHFFRHTGDIHAPPGLEKNDLTCTPDLQNTSEPYEDGTSSENNKNGVSKSLGEEITTDDNLQKDITLEKEENIVESIISDHDTNKVVDDIKKEIDANTNASNKCENDIELKETTLLSEEMEKDVDEKPAKLDENNIADEDDDDYLLYLEDILRRIHNEFYTNLEKDTGRRSLKTIIQRVRAQVLKGVHLTFSGLIPTHQKLHQSRAYKVARAFGAEVEQDLSDKTTHLVAIRPGTAKANTAKKDGCIQIVNPDWLWTSAERWEHVDERLFPLTTKARASRVPPPHCSSPERIEEQEVGDRFADSINPLMSFTPEEIENMDKEVEEDMADQELDPPIFDTEDAESLEECDRKTRRRNSDSEDSTNCEYDDTVIPTKRRKKIADESSEGENSSSEKEDNNDDDDDDDDDDPVTRFRRGEDLPDDLDLGDNSQDSVEDLEIMDNEDEGEWSAMGAALEREFLSQ